MSYEEKIRLAKMTESEGGYKKRKSNRKHPSKRTHNRKQHTHKCREEGGGGFEDSREERFRTQGVGACT